MEEKLFLSSLLEPFTMQLLNHDV